MIQKINNLIADILWFYSICVYNYSKTREGQYLPLEEVMQSFFGYFDLTIKYRELGENSEDSNNGPSPTCRS
jgi:hypothetical protein